MLSRGEHLYFVNDGGIAGCYLAKTGEVVWNSRLAGGNVTASPVMAGDKMLMTSEKGEVAVVKADKEFEELAKVSLGERVYSTPAVADGKVFVRGESHLFCFGKK